MSQQRKIPQRRCVGCREMKDKIRLVRIVRSPEGLLSLDNTGKANGRGTYLCIDENCLAKAQKTKGMERSLKCAIPQEIYEMLKNKVK